MNPENTVDGITRRDFLKIAAVKAVEATVLSTLLGAFACAPAPAAPTKASEQPTSKSTAAATRPGTITSTTPATSASERYSFADNTPSYPDTPKPSTFSAAPLLAIYNKFLNEPTLELLKSLDTTITDHVARYYAADGILANASASKTGGPIDRAQILRAQNKKFLTNLCGDARVICSDLTALAEGEEYTAMERRTLGAQPQVAEKGTRVSVLGTHCNSSGVVNGCGALDAFGKMKELGGEEFLRQHKIPEEVIQQLKTGLSSSNPEIQAVAAAKHQALVTALTNKEGHTAVAVVIGHADNSWKVLGAYNEFGAEVKVPELAKDFIARNSGKANLEINVNLLKQKPPVYVLNATGINTQTLLGQTAETPGKVFKITASPADGTRRAINVAEADAAIIGTAYPQANKWGRLQWIIANTQEELDLLRSRFLASDASWKFFETNGVMVEALVDSKGAFTGALKATRVADLGPIKASLLASRKVGLVTTKIPLSERTLKEAEAAVANGLAEDIPKATRIVNGLKGLGRFALNIINKLDPVFWYFTIDQMATDLEDALGYKTIYDNHARRIDRNPKNTIVLSIDSAPYSVIHQFLPKVETLLALEGSYDTSKDPYTRQELAAQFAGEVRAFIKDMNRYNIAKEGKDKYKITDKGSIFKDLSLDEIVKGLKLDFEDVHDFKRHVVLTKPGIPLVYFPIPPENYNGEKPWMLEADMQKQQFAIYNPSTGEALITGVEGSLIVPMIVENPKKGQEHTVYYIHLHMDKYGNMVTKNVGYDDSEKAFAKLQLQKAASAILGARNAKSAVLLRKNMDVTLVRGQGNDGGVYAGFNTPGGLWEEQVKRFNVYAPKVGEVRVGGVDPQTIFRG